MVGEVVHYVRRCHAGLRQFPAKRCGQVLGGLPRTYPAAWLAFEPAGGMPDCRSKGFLIGLCTR
jgi:hypothetical protein